MRSIWLVIKHDVGATLRQRSFWVLSLLLPILLLGLQVAGVVSRNNQGGPATGGQTSNTQATTPAAGQLPPIGLVDEAGLIAEFPAILPSDLFARFSDAASARAALEAGQIEQFVYLPADYVASGEVTVFDKDFQILRSGEDMGLAFGSDNAWMLQYLISFNLTRDEQLTTALRNPTPGTIAGWHALRPPPATEAQNEALVELVSSVMPYVFYFLLLIGSTYMMRSVVAEKESRTAEVLLTSLNPRTLMVGKILAMSVVVLIQVAVWGGGGILILNRGADLLNLSAYTFPPGFVVWALLFLVLGFLTYASVMAAAGAIAQNAREAGSMTFLLVVPLMPTLMFGELFAQQPDHPLTLSLSLFPLSAPSVMVTRLATGEVPLWQIAVSLAGLALTAYVFVVLAARFFRADHLLSDTPFSVRRLVTGWRR